MLIASGSERDIRAPSDGAIVGSVRELIVDDASSAASLNTDEVFAITFALSVLSVGFFGLIVAIERLTIPWFHTISEQEGAQ